MDRFVSPLVALLASFSASAADIVARPDWQRHFDAFGVRGTFVLLEPANDRYLVLNESRAKQGFIPASTFKIPNALIGLEVGAIADENEVFRWDGKPKIRSEWERDQTLDTGMKYSVVWMFQEVARRIGKERMKEWLVRLDYGNRDMRGGIDQFWLQGAIRISAFQQVDFLRKLSEGELRDDPALAAPRARGARVREDARVHALCQVRLHGHDSEAPRGLVGGLDRTQGQAPRVLRDEPGPHREDPLRGSHRDHARDPRRGGRIA